MSAPRLSRRALGELRNRLSERDLELLRSLEAHRYLTTGQLARLFFAREHGTPVAARACVRVLGRLRELGLVERLDRQVGGQHAGSAAFVWRVSRSGRRLVLLDNDRSYQRTAHLPSLDHLAHVLAVAEVHVLVVELARAGSIELLEVELEPACWRRFVGAEGAPEILKPDLGLVTASGDYEEHWFVEVDRGREAMRVLLAKCAQYTAYARSGREQAARSVFPYVLWVMPTQERADRLEREARLDPAIDDSLLRAATPSTLLDAFTGASLDAPVHTNIAPSGLVRLLAGGAHRHF